MSNNAKGSSDQDNPLIPGSDPQPKVRETAAFQDSEVSVQDTESRLKIWMQTKIPVAGHVLALISCLVFTFAACIVKSLDTVDPFLLASARNVLVLLFSSPFVLKSGLKFCPQGKEVKLGIKVACASANLCLMYYSFRHLPLGDCRMISSSAPIFVTILARTFLKEPCGLFEVFNMTLTLIGIILVMQPPFLFGTSNGSDGYKKKHFYVAVLALSGTLFSAVSITATRSLKDVNVFLITFWNGLFGIFPPFLLCYFIGRFEVPTLNECGFIFLLSFVSFLGQILITWALQVEEAGTISLARKAEDILFAFLMQVIYYGDIPTWVTLIGFIIVTFSVILGGIRKIAEHKTEDEVIRKIFCLPRTI